MKNRIKKYSKNFWKKEKIEIPNPSDEEIAESLQTWSQFPEICAEVYNLKEAYHKILEGFSEEEVQKVHKRYGKPIEILSNICAKIMNLMNEDVEQVSKGDNDDS